MVALPRPGDAYGTTCLLNVTVMLQPEVSHDRYEKNAFTPQQILAPLSDMFSGGTLAAW